VLSEKKKTNHTDKCLHGQCWHYSSRRGQKDMAYVSVQKQYAYVSISPHPCHPLHSPLPWRRPAPAPSSVCEASIPVITQPLPPSRTAIEIIFYSNLRHDNNKKSVGSLKGNQAPDFVCTLVVCLCGCEVCGGVGSVWGCCNVWCTCVSLSN
jgi:hypothetical protein